MVKWLARGALGMLVQISAATGQAGGVAATTAAATVSRTVSGRVVNAVTGAPIARALVNLNSRAELTDAQGRFSFAQFTDANGFAQVTKPGYSGSAFPDAPRMTKVLDLDSPVELKLYPDALVTGTVSGPDGQPLGHLQVRLLRLAYDPTGTRWTTAGNTQTSERGEYRFDVAAGRYRVSTQYLARSQERGEAVLPVIVPATTSSYSDGYLDLGSGDQREVDLRPRVAPSYAVKIAVDGGEARRGVRMTAIGASGIPFRLPARGTGDDDHQVLTAQLPAGTFQLQVSLEDGDDSLQGEGRVTVTGRGTAQTEVHLTKVADFPVEMSFEAVPAANGVVPANPNPRQFNLTLRNPASTGDGVNQDVRLQQEDGGLRFSATPGRYRMTGSGSGSWFVRSVTYGVTDLMTQDLVVALGAAGAPIRVVVSNAVGQVKGQVMSDGQPVNAGWVYLVPMEPGLTPYIEVTIQLDGTFAWTGAQGRYAAIAVDRQARESFLDAETTKRFVAQGQTVEIVAGGVASSALRMRVSGR